MRAKEGRRARRRDRESIGRSDCVNHRARRPRLRVEARARGPWQGDLNPTYKSARAAPPVRKKGFAEMVPSGMPGPKDLEREKEKAGDTGDGGTNSSTYSLQ